MNDEEFMTMATTAAVSFMEVQRQLAEVADNVEKMFRQNEEGFSAAYQRRRK